MSPVAPVVPSLASSPAASQRLDLLHRSKRTLTSLGKRVILAALVLPILLARLFGSFNADSPLFSRVVGRVEVPVELRDRALFVNVTINGRGPFHMLVDTGASISLITPAVATETEAREDDSDDAQTVSSNGFGDTAEVSCVMLRTLEVGAARFEGVRAGVSAGLAPMARATGQRVDGVIGFSLFSDLFLALDFPGQRLVLDRAWPKDLPPIRAELEVREVEEVPTITGRLQGLDFEFSVDTGSNRGVQMSAEQAQPLTWKAEPRPGPLVNVIGETGREYLGRAGGEFHLQQVTQTEPIVTLMPGSASLGVGFLRHFCVVFDQAHDKMWLCAATDAPVPSPPERSLGLSLMTDVTGWRVAATIPGSPAEGLGLIAGDVVTRIEGKPAGSWSRDQIATWIDLHPKIAVSIAHGDSSRDISLPVWSLVP